MDLSFEQKKIMVIYITEREKKTSKLHALILLKLKYTYSMNSICTLIFNWTGTSESQWERCII